MTNRLHIGFTGTRHGMSDSQRHTVMRMLEEQLDDVMIATRTGPVAHHGCCVGADAEFHEIAQRFLHPIGGTIAMHPGPDGEYRAKCALESQGDVIYDPMPHARRNTAIIAASHIMIAAPFEPEPQKRGGTWMTIRMAMRAVRAGKLRALYVVGRDGKLLEWEGWRL